MVGVIKILSYVMHTARVTCMDKPSRNENQNRITNFDWHPRKICLVSMATLQNEISGGGLGLPNLEIINKPIVTGRIAKIMITEKPGKGQLIYRNDHPLRQLLNRHLRPWDMRTDSGKLTFPASLLQRTPKPGTRLVIRGLSLTPKEVICKN